VTLEVAKQAAIYHGVATILSQASPVMSRGKMGCDEGCCDQNYYYHYYSNNSSTLLSLPPNTNMKPYPPPVPHLSIIVDDEDQTESMVSESVDEEYTSDSPGVMITPMDEQEEGKLMLNENSLLASNTATTNNGDDGSNNPSSNLDSNSSSTITTNNDATGAKRCNLSLPVRDRSDSIGSVTRTSTCAFSQLRGLKNDFSGYPALSPKDEIWTNSNDGSGSLIKCRSEGCLSEWNSFEVLTRKGLSESALGVPRVVGSSRLLKFFENSRNVQPKHSRCSADGESPCEFCKF